MTGWIQEGRAVGVVYLTSARPLTLSPLSGKLRNYGLDEQAVRGIENWLSGRAQRLVTSGAKPSWRPEAVVLPRGQHWAVLIGPVSPLLTQDRVGKNRRKGLA